MAAYIIAQIEVHDREEYKKYQVAFNKASEPYGVKVLVATDDVAILEGEWPKMRTVVMEYSSIQTAREWYKSKQYQNIIDIRHQSAKTNMILVDGFSSNTSTK